MKQYCTQIENNKELSDKYRRNIKKIEEWYKKINDKYQNIFKTELVYNLFQEEKITGEDEDVVFDIFNNYEDAFDTKVSMFAMADILCKHILSTFSYGPINDGVLSFKSEDVGTQDRSKSWFDYKGGSIDLIEILQYFLEKENVRIDGIDLAVLQEERSVRNKLIHGGEFQKCLSGIRCFNIIRSMILYMDEEARGYLPEFVYPESSLCDMQNFFDQTNSLNFKDYTTILVTGSLMDLNRSHVANFLGLPWNIILDFSGGKPNKGMRGLVSTDRIHQQSLSGNNIQGVMNKLSLASDYTEWLICGEYLTPYLAPHNTLQRLVTDKDPFYVGDRAGYVDHIDKIVQYICKAANSRLKPVVIVFMYTNDIVAVRLLNACQKMLKNEYSFAGVYYWDVEKRNKIFVKVFEDICDNMEDVQDIFGIYPCDLGSFLKGLSDYGVGQQVERENELLTCREVPSFNGYIELSKNLAYDLEQYFDVLYKEIGKNDIEREKSLQEFYRGRVAPWSAFYDGNVTDLIRKEEKDGYVNKIKSILGKIPDRKTDKVFYIEHAPGIGGSTLLRILGWELYKDYPVLMIRNYDKNNTKKVLQQFYDTVKRAFVVLADESFFELEELESDIKNLQRACALVVSIRDSNVGVGSHIRLPFKKISGAAERQLRGLFKAQSPLTAKEKEKKDCMYTEFIQQDNMMKSPFMIGLYYMDREFYGVEDYVARVIESVIDEKELKAIGFIAMADLYGQTELPKIVINRFLGLSTNTNYVVEHNYVQSVLLYDAKKACYKSKHPIISDKLLNLCSKKIYQKEFSEKMREWAKAYIDLIICECKNGFHDVYQSVLEKVFIRNRVVAINGESNSDFSKFIEDVKLLEHRVDILEYLALTCKEFADTLNSEDNPQIYLMTAHFYGHLGRLYGKGSSGIRNYTKALESSRISMEYMQAGGENDSRVYHMHAKTRSDKLIYEWEESYFGEEISKTVFENYEDEIYEICTIYNKAAEYGGGGYAYPSQMDILIKYLEFVYRQKGISKAEDLVKLSEKQQEYRTNIGVICDQLDGYEYDEESLAAIDILIRKYQTGVMLGSYGNAIQYYENKLYNAQKNQEIPSVIERYRSGLINAKISKYKVFNGKTWYIDSKISQDEIKEILQLIEVALAQGYDVQNFQSRQRRSVLYNNWITLAKYSTKAVSDGIIYAKEWKELVEKDKKIDPRPYYYLYVLYYLSVLEGNVDNKKYLSEFQTLCSKKAIQAGKSLNYIKDLLIEGKGMGQLREIHGMDVELINKISKEHKLIELTGKFIDIVPGKGVVQIKKPIPWLRYEAKFDLLKQNSVGESQLTHELSFFGGFSYEQIIAISSSVKDVTSGERFKENFENENIVQSIGELEEVDILKKRGEQKKKIEISQVNEEKGQVVIFVPKRIVKDPKFQNVYYLNGQIEDGRLAGLSSYDIECFDETRNGKIEPVYVLKQLEKLQSFKVVIQKSYEDRCTVSVFDTDVKLVDLFADMKSDFLNNLEGGVKKEIVSFNPDDEDLKTDGIRYYLNGFLPNNCRGGLSSDDIELFGEELAQFGTSEDVLRKLKRLKSFNVSLEDAHISYKCRVSLFNTGVSLSELLKNDQVIPEVENLKIIEEDVEEKSVPLPDVTGMVTLIKCDFSKEKTISGFIEVQGKQYPAIVSSVSPKMMKIYKKRTKISAKVKGKNKEQYILQLL